MLVAPSSLDWLAYILLSNYRSCCPENADLALRAQYMETLIRHYVGDINLDLESLRSTVEALDKESGSRPRSPSISHDSNEPEAEENYSMQLLDNNITRKLKNESHCPKLSLSPQIIPASSRTGTFPCE
jgi:hypothetical protein